MSIHRTQIVMWLASEVPDESSDPEIARQRRAHRPSSRRPGRRPGRPLGLDQAQPGRGLAPLRAARQPRTGRRRDPGGVPPGLPGAPGVPGGFQCPHLVALHRPQDVRRRGPRPPPPAQAGRQVRAAGLRTRPGSVDLRRGAADRARRGAPACLRAHAGARALVPRSRRDLRMPGRNDPLARRTRPGRPPRAPRGSDRLPRRPTGRRRTGAPLPPPGGDRSSPATGSRPSAVPAPTRR